MIEAPVSKRGLLALWCDLGLGGFQGDTSCPTLKTRLTACPRKVVFIGDSPRADIEGPRAAGMKAVHVDELVAAMRQG